jgi:hypothetical protein
MDIFFFPDTARLFLTFFEDDAGGGRCLGLAGVRWVLILSSTRRDS